MKAGAMPDLDPTTRRFLDTLRQLWPAAEVSTQQESTPSVPRPRAGSEDCRWLVLPRVGGPRMLLPDSGHLATDAMRGFSLGNGGGLRHQLASWVIAHGGQRVVGETLTMSEPAGSASIETFLSDVLETPVRVALRIDPTGAETKPVLQVLDTDGNTRAFAKIGITPHASRLVRTEARALSVLEAGSLRDVVAPRPLHHGSWQGLELLVQTPLPPAESHRPARDTMLTAMREVALCGEVRVEPLLDSGYLRRLQKRLARLRSDETSAMLHQALGAMVRERGGVRWWFGSWHGDWTEDNCGALDGRVVVCSWDRFDSPVPCGFDALHLELRSRLSRVGGRTHAAERLLEDADQLLSGWGVPAGEARAVVTAYLVDVGTRFLEEDPTGERSHARQLQTWLLPALVKEASRLAGPGAHS